jgi:hypothetical protein
MLIQFRKIFAVSTFIDYHNLAQIKETHFCCLTVSASNLGITCSKLNATNVNAENFVTSSQ